MGIRNYELQDRVTLNYRFMQRFITGVTGKEKVSILDMNDFDNAFVMSIPTVRQLRYDASAAVRLRSKSELTGRINLTNHSRLIAISHEKENLFRVH